MVGRRILEDLSNKIGKEGFVGQDGSRMVCLSTHHVKKLGTDRQTRMPKSPYVQRSSIGTARVARANMRWRREHVRGKE